MPAREPLLVAGIDAVPKRPQAHRLWTPIANALEVYRRRLIAAPDAMYEHIWRIIHIEEAMIVLLGSALAARLHSLWSGSDEERERLNDLRSKITGLRLGDDGSVATSDSGQACWQGSIGAWTDLMNVYGRPDTEPACGFCTTLGQYLVEEPDTDIVLIDAWQRISPVPTEIFKTRIGRLKAINNLRNKLAHVPVSEKLLAGVHKGLRQEILGLLSPDPALLEEDTAADIVTTKWHDPLIGRLCTPNAGVTGSDFCQHDGRPGEDHGGIWFEWARSGHDLAWPASPFVLLDNELKTMLLFRADGLEDDPGERDIGAEYYRFGAEIEPVQKHLIQRDQVQPWIPEPPEPPAESDEKKPPNDAGGGSAGGKEAEAGTAVVKPMDLSAMGTAELRAQAEACYRRREYPDAVAAFDELSSRGRVPEYNHVSMLHHGEAIWKSAERVIEDAAARTTQLRRSIDVLGTATEHNDLSYAARAYYQRSKAHRRLWLLTGDESHYERAREDASDAARMAYESQYVSWFERVVAEDPRDCGQ